MVKLNDDLQIQNSFGAMIRDISAAVSKVFHWR